MRSIVCPDIINIPNFVQAFLYLASCFVLWRYIVFTLQSWNCVSIHLYLLGITSFVIFYSQPFRSKISLGHWLCWRKILVLLFISTLVWFIFQRKIVGFFVQKPMLLSTEANVSYIVISHTVVRLRTLWKPKLNATSHQRTADFWSDATRTEVFGSRHGDVGAGEIRGYHINDTRIRGQSGCIQAGRQVSKI